MTSLPSTLGTRLRQMSVRLAASDPGLVRLGMATTTVVTLALSLGVLYGITQVARQPFTVAMLGVVISMIASMAFKDPKPLQRLLTAALIFAIAAASVTVGALLVADKIGGDVVFVAIMIAATAARRFGARATILGMVAFMTYFFALFLGATLAMLPWLIVALAIGTAVSVGMALVLGRHPDRQLRRALRSLEARLVLLLGTVGAGLARAQLNERDHHRLMTRMEQLSETTLMIDSELDGPEMRARKAADEIEALRLQLFDVELAAENLARAWLRAASADADASSNANARAQLADAVGVLSGALRFDGSSGDRPDVLAQQLRDDPTIGPRYRGVALALAELSRSAKNVFTADLRDGASSEQVAGVVPVGAEQGQSAAEEPQSAGTEQPGSVTSAAPDAAIKTPWTERLAPTTRQAVQVAVAASLAIIVGERLSSARWYWAVIAAFVVYSGTATRGETLTKGQQRIVGTIVGVAIGAAIASLVGGNVIASLCLIFVSLFIGFYLMQVSYAFMVIGTTTMLALLYGLLGQFTIGLLLVRIEETFIGAAIGVVTALFVLPIKTSTTVKSDVRSYLGALRDLIEHAGRRMCGTSDDDLVPQARDLDRLLTALRSDAKPLSAGMFPTRGRGSTRRWLGVLAACGHYARGLVRTSDRALDQPGAPELQRIVSRVNDNIAALTGMLDDRRVRALVSTDDLFDSAAAAMDFGSSEGGERRKLALALHCLRSIDLGVTELSQDFAVAGGRA